MKMLHKFKNLFLSNLRDALRNITKSVLGKI